MIRIFCDAADALLKETQTLTAGMEYYPEVQLSFSDDWNGFAKAAVVRAGDVSKSVLIVNNGFTVPYECLAEAGVNLIIGISGSKDGKTIPTIWCSAGEILEAVDIDIDGDPGEPTPSLVEQMLDYAEQIEEYAAELDNSVIRDVELSSEHIGEYGTPTASLDDSGAGANRTLTITLAYLRGKGINKVAFTSSGELKGRVQVQMDDGEIINYDGIKEALAYLATEEGAFEDAEELRVIAENLRVAAETERQEAETARQTEWSSWGDIVGDAEAYGTGTRKGSPVAPSDPAYQNNSKYYSEASSGFADNSEQSSFDSEAFAAGTRDGSPVESTDPAYHNNAAYYADLAEQSAGVAGYMDLHIDEDGHLIYTKTDNVDNDFYIDSNGHLIWVNGPEEDEEENE